MYRAGTVTPFYKNIDTAERSRKRLRFVFFADFSGVLFDAPFLSVAGETFPGDPDGSVFDGRLIAVWGKGGAVKNRGAKHPLTCAAQLNFVSSQHEEIYLSRKKGWKAKRPLTCAASAVAEAMAGQAASQARLPHGGSCFTSKGCFNCAASAVAEAMAGQAASQARLPHGGILFYTNRAPNKRSAVEAHK